MNKKKLTYVVMLIAIIIWGKIILDFFNVFSEQNETIQIETTKKAEVVESSYVLDTFSINPNYRDPFLGEIVKKKVVVDQKPTTKVVNKPPVIPTKWPTILYSGVIKNQTTKVELALVQVNGKSGMLKVGEKMDEIELLKITADSIQVKFGKEKRFVKK